MAIHTFEITELEGEYTADIVALFGEKGDTGTTDYNELINTPDLTLKADKADTYTKIEVDTSLAGKAELVHVHAISDVTGLQSALDSKSATDHTHTAANVTDFDTEVSNNTDVAANTAARHTHANKAVLDAATASFTTADEMKLDGIATGATANATDAQLRDRTTHTGTQAISTVTGLQTALDGKAADSSVVKLTGDQTIAGVKTFSSSPIVPTATTTTQAVNKSQMDAADALKVNKAGDTMTGNLTISNPQGIKALDIASSFDGGYNNFDSTGRINLHSHQRAQKNNNSGTNTSQAHYGEVIRIDMEEQQAKGVIAFREDYLGATEGPRTVAWLVAHGEANDSTPQNPVWHNHFSIELPDETGALQTSLEFPFAPNGLPNAFGMPTEDRYVRAVVPLVSSADMWVEQNAGVQKNYYFSSGKYKNNAGKRWGLQSDSTAETGSNAGSDFRINAYDDSGTYTRTPVYIKRSNGYIGIATTSPTRMIDINSDSVRLRTAKTPVSSTATGENGQICWDNNYIYVCVANNTWKRSPLTDWSGTSIGGVLHLTGTGFPNGVVSAPVGSIYIDTAVTNGASSWIKKSGTGNTGWQVLEGDTGWRIVSADVTNGWTGQLRIRRTNNMVYISAGRYSLTGAAATSDAFYTLPLGFMASGSGNFGFIGVAGVGSAIPTMELVEVNRITYLVSCRARSQISGDWSFLTDNAWPTTLPGVSV